MADSPELAAAKRLLDAAKDQGFTFARIAPGPDGPLRGVRDTVEWRDEIYLAGADGPIRVPRFGAAARHWWCPADCR